MVAYEAIGSTAFDLAVYAAMFVLLAGVFLFGQRHVIAARWRVASKHRRVRRDLHRQKLVRAAQRAAADRMGAGTCPHGCHLWMAGRSSEGYGRPPRGEGAHPMSAGVYFLLGFSLGFAACLLWAAVGVAFFMWLRGHK